MRNSLTIVVLTEALSKPCLPFLTLFKLTGLYAVNCQAVLERLLLAINEKLLIVSGTANSFKSETMFFCMMANKMQS